MINIARKDFLLLWNWGTVILFGLFAFVSVTSTQPVALTAVWYTIIFPIVIASFEDRHKGQKLVCSLPVKRNEIVTTRYVEGLIYSLIGYMLALAIDNLVAYMRGFELVSFTVTELMIALTLNFVMLAVFYPINFKFGMISVYVSFGIFIVFIMFIRPFVYMMNITGAIANIDMYSLVLFLGTLLLYGLSYLLSLQIYRKQDF